MAIPNNIDKLNWSSSQDDFIDMSIAHWLLDTGSLTAKLKTQYTDFKVQILDEIVAPIVADEQIFFQALPPQTQYHHRQVLLLGNQVPKIYAQSIIPKTADTEKILPLGTQPLGEILFNQPNLKRCPTEFTKTTDNIWGRRCLFYFHQTPILVCEFFL